MLTSLRRYMKEAGGQYFNIEQTHEINRQFMINKTLQTFIKKYYPFHRGAVF